MTIGAIPPPARSLPAEQITLKARAARAAALSWRRYALSERVRLLRALWREIESRSGALLRVVHEETGKPFAEIESMELGTARVILKYYTANAHRILQDQAAWRPWIFFNKRAYVRYVPRGLIGVITPWNLPFLIPFADSAAALLAGNAVLLKPSEWTTRTALWLEDVVSASGLLPGGLFSVVTGDGAAGAQVVREADMVLFTGSHRAGRLVAQAAAEDLKPAVLELGGKHPMIVLKDAAIDRAAKAAVWGAFANCGQLCVGVERVFVEAEAYDPFVEAVRREMAGLRQGLGGTDVDVGRLIFPPALARIKDQLEDARTLGAKVIGGDIFDEAALLVTPALVLDAAPAMKVMSEETFGPVMPVMKVDRGEDAVRLANAGPYGLSASVWTTDLTRGERLAAALESGVVGVNDVGSHYAICSLPFGGIKASGLGRRHSDEGLRQFCWPQSVFVHEWPASSPDPWWFPYDAGRTRLVSWLTRLV